MLEQSSSPAAASSQIQQSREIGPALAISKGIDRDRAVDESGNQLAVFGRRGARPLNHHETQRLYLRNGQLYTVTDEPEECLHTTSNAMADAWAWLARVRSELLP